MPIAVINLFLTWIILSLFFLGRPKFSSGKHHSAKVTKESTTEDVLPENSSQHVAKHLQRKLDELGKISFHEWIVIALISIAVILWLFRDPQVFPGWFSLFPEGHPKIGDSTVAVAILVIMFIIPKELSYFRGGTLAHIHMLISNEIFIEIFQNLLGKGTLFLVGNSFNNIFLGT